MHDACMQGEVDYVGVNGCCNDDVGAQGTYQIDGQAESVSTGLPYMQLLTCQAGGLVRR